MKLSELFQYALDNHYTRDEFIKVRSNKESVYMCLALENCQTSNKNIESALISKAKDHIMHMLQPYFCITLDTLLGRTSKLYKSYRLRWGFESKACFKIRVNFWKEVIANLQEQGL